MKTPLSLQSPLNYQVIQRRTAREGVIPVAGHCAVACDRVEVRLAGTTGWLPAKLDAKGNFKTNLWAPAGGWYVLKVRANTGATARVSHVGVGEVFVGAGQSNSTSCGGFQSKSPRDGRTQPKSGMVSTFDGTRWRIAHDPQPGAHDTITGGSFWPAFGDAMAARFNVPIGVAMTGHAGTSIRQWTKDDVLFQWTLARLRQLGRDCFRALLWHQGETDADMRMPADRYAAGLGEIIGDFRKAIGRDFPFFIAQATFIPWPRENVFREIRGAQRRLWKEGIALQGPDTDAMRGALRDMDGKGIHFSKKGLKVHGEAWAVKVGAWLEAALAQQAPSGRRTHHQRSRL